MLSQEVLYIISLRLIYGFEMLPRPHVSSRDLIVSEAVGGT